MAPFAIYLSNKLQKYNTIDKFVSVVKDIGFVISSMKQDYWSPRYNQEIIIDTLLDKPFAQNEEPWGITNTC